MEVENQKSKRGGGLSDYVGRERTRGELSLAKGLGSKSKWKSPPEGVNGRGRRGVFSELD